MIPRSATKTIGMHGEGKSGIAVLSRLFSPVSLRFLPLLRLFHLTTVDSMPSYHTMHSSIAQVNPGYSCVTEIPQSNWRR